MTFIFHIKAVFNLVNVLLMWVWKDRYTNTQYKHTVQTHSTNTQYKHTVQTHSTNTHTHTFLENKFSKPGGFLKKTIKYNHTLQ